MKHFMSEMQLGLEEFADFMREGEDLSLETQMRQQARHLHLDAKKALDQAGNCLSDFANKLISHKKKTLGAKFIAKAETLYSKVKKATNSEKDKSILSGLHKLMGVLSDLIHKVTKAFGFSKDLLSPSPTVLHREPSSDKKQTIDKKHFHHENKPSKNKKKH